MAAPQEIYSFVNKFMNLCRNGEDANLSLQCNQGRSIVTLQVHLRPFPPPPYHSRPPQHPSPQSHPCQRPNPSRLRRYKRREHARYENEKVSKADESEKVNNFSEINDAISSSNTTEQVDASHNALKTAEKATSIKVNDEQAIPVHLSENDEGDNTEEVFYKITDEKTQIQHPEGNTVEKTDLTADASQEKKNYDIEKVTESTVNKSGETAHQQFKNLLICNYCDKGFANEELLREHTSIDHRSGRIRYRRT